MVDRSKMQYRHLGRSGLLVSTLSFGNWLTGSDSEVEESQFQCVSKAMESGINFFDTAEAYGFGAAETTMGNIFKRGGWDRDDYVLSTKFYMSGNDPNAKVISRKHLIQGMRNSLRRLQLDFVDIMFLHRPDQDVPLRESLHSINHLIEKGRVDYWGTSEYSPTRLLEIYRLCDKHGYPYPIAEQSQYNMFHRERIESELAMLYDKYGLGTTIWSPLAGGLLTGKYNDGVLPNDSRYANATSGSLQKKFETLFGEQREKTIHALQTLAAVAGEMGCTQSQLVLAWTMYNKDVSTAINGASRVSQLEDNVGALEVLEKLDVETLRRIDQALDNEPPRVVNFRHGPHAEPTLTFRAPVELPSRRGY